MIPPLVQAGHRVIVPDLIGFGRSDKPIDRSVYTYDQHVEWMKAFVRSFDDIGPFDVFCQDWGGLISLFPGAAHQPHHQFPTGGHFIQADEGPALAAAAIDWFAATT